MDERMLDIKTGSGVMETFVTHPNQHAPFPAVILYMDVWGVREELFDIARRIATVGYYCMVPDLYYRLGKVRHEFRNDKNEMISLEYLSDEQKEKVRTPMRQLTDAMVVEDTGAMLDFIERGEPVHPGAMGAIGYGMGGRHVLRVAGSFPQRFRAGASLHGTRLVTDNDSPHLTAMRAHGELYCGFAEKDPYAPMSTVNKLPETLPGPQLAYRHEVHK